MLNKSYRLILLLLMLTGFCCEVAAEPELIALAQRIATAAEQGKPALVLSITEVIDEEQAYHIQSLAVRQRLAGIAPEGFKAGLTSKAGQQMFGVTQAVAGVLLSGGQLFETAVLSINSTDFNNMMMEVELGFEFNTRITEPVDSIEALKSKVSKVLPIVELPDLSFDQPKRLKGVDIIANNVVAKQFVYGVGMPPQQLELNTLQVSIKREGELILTGRGDDVMGDQWQALLWLVNRTIKNGWHIEPGQRLITGALGRMIPALTGNYQLDYGFLGTINIKINENRAH